MNTVAHARAWAGLRVWLQAMALACSAPGPALADQALADWRVPASPAWLVAGDDRLPAPQTSEGPRATAAELADNGHQRQELDKRELRQHWLAAVLGASLLALGGLALLLWRLKHSQRLLAEARRLARQRSDFLAHLSHELRTPLNGILGFAELLHGDAALNARQQRALTIIRQSGQHLLQLTSDLLDMSRIDAGRVDLCPAPVNPVAYVQAVGDMMRGRIEDKGLRFDVELGPELPPGVRLDELRLRQVLLNLLANAVKFTDAGQVSLRVLLAEAGAVPHAGATAGHSGNTDHSGHLSHSDHSGHLSRSGHSGHSDKTARLRFEVEDSGIGISLSQLGKLFQPFEQVSEEGRRRGGAGLGLAISQQLVRLMGGNIQVDSQPGQGSLFWFELELPRCAPPGPGTPNERPTGMAAAKPAGSSEFWLDEARR